MRTGTRRSADEVLGAIGPAAVAAVPALITALNDGDGVVGSGRACAGEDLVPPRRRLFRHWTQALNEANQDLSILAAEH